MTTWSHTLHMLYILHSGLRGIGNRNIATHQFPGTSFALVVVTDINSEHSSCIAACLELK